MNVYVDMDGVLCDFIRGACEVHGLCYYEVLDDWKRGEWDDITRIVEAETGDRFWDPIRKAGSSFWRWLEPLPWLDQMVGLARKIDYDWHIASMCAADPASAAGKTEWINGNFGITFDRYYLCRRDKQRLAHPGALLIDDKDLNVNQWRLRGGKAVLVPQVWNSNHHIWEDGDEAVMDYVRETLDHLTGGKIYGGSH